MLEIEEVMPFYLCNGPTAGFVCVDEECDEGCKHTTLGNFAKNPHSVRLLKKFVETFDFIVDDYGRLQCWEKEKNDKSKD